MCGILACISRRDKRIDEELLRRAGDKMAYRGPDNQGLYLDEWIGMLHNRLSIIDLSEKANQPMFSHDRRYAVIYNGEIYNYKELRKELEGFGFNFKTQSDTEVLLNAYIKFSSDCLNRLRGMFSFVIVDFHKNEVFIARDHFGIKPLYLHESADYIILSSDIKSISEFVQLEPNYEVYYEQVMFRYVAGKNTCFKNIKKILPGHFHVYKKYEDKFEEHQYYRLADTFFLNGRFAEMAEDDIIEEVEEILTESIKIHTYSDVGYNLEFSGGVDSGLIAAILTKKLKCNNLTSYSIALPDNKKLDETRYQDIVADTLGLKNYKIEMTNELFSNILEEAAYFMERPLVHIGCVCLFYLTKYSALNSKVILTGEGADETFGGYREYVIPQWRRFLYHNLFSIPGIEEYVYTQAPLALLRHRAIWPWYESPIKVFDKAFSRKYLSKPDLSYKESLFKAVRKKDVTSKLLYHDQMSYLTTLLDRQDKMSMANSVEARVPFCDKKVYEFMNGVPHGLKLKNGEWKYILKKIASKYLPEEAICRPKNGLNLPFKEWLEEDKFLGRYLGILLDDTAKKRGIYDIKYINHIIKMQRTEERDYSRRLMGLIVFELWHRIFFDRKLEPKIYSKPATEKINLVKVI